MSFENQNKLTGEIISAMVPTMALIAYEGMGKFSGKYYLESRRIGENGIMGVGMPVTHSFMESISKSYNEQKTGTPHGAIPENMLYCDTRRGSERYVWYNPPCKRTMYFRQNLGLENTEYHVPGVIYVARSCGLEVYAFTGEKPNGDSRLYNGPFFNTSNGNVCLGSAKLKMPVDPTYENVLHYWEKRFWMTEFSHLGGAGNPTKDNLVIVTKTSIDKPFDEGQLMPAGKTLKQFLK